MFHNQLGLVLSMRGALVASQVCREVISPDIEPHCPCNRPPRCLAHGVGDPKVASPPAYHP